MEILTGKMSLLKILLLCGIFVSSYAENVDLVLPDTIIKEPDSYICSAHPLKMGKVYLQDFDFSLNSGRPEPRRIAVFGCEEPEQEAGSWQCGPRFNGQVATDHPALKPGGLAFNLTKGICKNPNSIKLLYQWSPGTPETKFPEDAGFAIGKDSHTKTIVVQEFYATAFKDGETAKKPNGNSIRLEYTSNTVQRVLRSLFVVVNNGIIPAGKTTSAEVACKIRSLALSKAHILFIQAITNELGRVASAFKIVKPDSGSSQWTMIGEYNPQIVQTYKAPRADATFSVGEYFATRCVYVNDGEKDINIGSGDQDELCNFHVIYWTDISDLPNEPGAICPGNGPPLYSFETDKDNKFDNIPEVHTVATQLGRAMILPHHGRRMKKD